MSDDHEKDATCSNVDKGDKERSTRLLSAIDALIQKDRGCLCGTFERCEVCNSHSYFNRLRDEIYEVIHGPRPKPAIEDYGRTISISMPDLTGR